MDCPLCVGDGGELIARGDGWRIVLVDDDRFPGFCRVIWNAHVAEMTDLPVEQRGQLLDVVWRVEATMRRVLQPDKINLASLGNAVPHVHWHVIPRWRDDSHFPDPIWAPARRIDAPTPRLSDAKLMQLTEALGTPS